MKSILSAVGVLAGPNNSAPFRRMPRLLEIDSNELSHDRMSGDRSTARFSAIIQSGTFGRYLDERTQMRGCFREDLPGWLSGIPFRDVWKQSGDVRHADVPTGPGADDFRNGSQTQRIGDALCKGRGRLRIQRPQRGSDSFPADPEAAAFVAEMGAPPDRKSVV